MTINLNPDRQCKGKSTFGSKLQAKNWHKRNVTLNGATSPPMRAYRCPHCDWFHLGHVTPQLKERLRGES